MRAAAEHPGRPRRFYAASRAAITAVANVSVEASPRDPGLLHRMIPIRADIPPRKRRASAGTKTQRTASWPISMPTLKESSDTSRYDPANCSCSYSTSVNPNPWTKASAVVITRTDTEWRRCGPPKF